MRIYLIGIVVALVTMASPGGTNAEPASPAKGLAETGKTLIEANCARCHATSKTGDSPLAKAPRFRELSRKYPIESLSEALAEGIMTGHPAMPQFTFTPPEIDAILAYLNAIQTP